MPLNDNKRDVVQSMPIFYSISFNVKTDLEWHSQAKHYQTINLIESLDIKT